MIPSWLLKDGFLWQELFKLALSLIGSLFLAWLIQIIITRRDQRNQEIERKNQQIRDLRNEFVEIFNEYYKVRKRYKTVRDTILEKKISNPYIKDDTYRINEIFDGLLLICMDLEVRYSTLIDRLSTTLPDLWESELKTLMSGRTTGTKTAESYLQEVREIRHKIENGEDISGYSLEAYLHIIRLQIEAEQYIGRSVRKIINKTFHLILVSFESYEKQIFSRSRSAKRESRIST